MKIAFMFYEDLINPQSFPLGIGLLSSVLKNAGHDVEGVYVHSRLDNVSELEKISDRVRAINPDIICFSATSASFEQIAIISKHLRQTIKTTTIAGGVHPTLYPEDTLLTEGIDYVCVGDGEKPLLEFLERHQRGESLVDIPGIWSLGTDNKVIKNKVPTLVSNLDELPWTDYDAFGKQFIDEITNDGWLRLISSRGCPYNCSYCHIKMIKQSYANAMELPVGKVGYIRFRSVDSVIEELKHMKEKYDLKVVNFMDDLFCMKKDRTIEFCEKFKKELPSDMGFSIQTHLDYLDQEIVDSLRDARCLRVVVGVESASKRILKIFNRTADTTKIRQQLSLLVNAKFPLGTWTLNMLGNPTETKEEMLETIAFNAGSLAERAKFNFMAPYEGSEIHTFCKERDLIKGEHEVQKFEDRYNSVLKFPPRETAFLEKFFDIGHWYMNMSAPLKLETYYGDHIEEIEKIGPGEWRKFRDHYLKLDEELSARLVKEGKMHYDFVLKGKIIGNVIGLVGGDDRLER
ncbi:B12-binding domain-containing radical SAM protein [Candidatus Pacearchaeota archaeon]|nr:B12-binding domain-containing radical SAM protein [Candidatus Pacearchaeota archaeon]